MNFILSRQPAQFVQHFSVISLFILDDLVDGILKSLGVYHPSPINVLLNKYLKYLLLGSAHKWRVYMSFPNISLLQYSDNCIVFPFTFLGRELETKMCLG